MLTPGAENVGAAAPSGATDADFDGDGITDYTVVRSIAAPALQGGQFKSIAERIQPDNSRFTNKKDNVRKSSKESLGEVPGDTLQWWINNSSDGSFTSSNFGNPASDFFTPADFDGDGRSDIAVWRGVSLGAPSGNGFFFIINSSDSTVSTVDFGQNNDTPTVVADYDGDGTADPAVYRCPNGGPFGPCTFFYQGSAGSGITFVPFGDNTDEDIKWYPGDFDGDGTADFAIYRQIPGSAGQGQYVILRSSDGTFEYINFGLKTVTGGDILVPGDYDGDGMTDFGNVRVVGGVVEWWILERDGGFAQADWGTINNRRNI